MPPRGNSAAGHIALITQTASHRPYHKVQTEAGRMHGLGHGTREQFADAQAKLIYGSLLTPSGAAASPETTSTPNRNRKAKIAVDCFGNKW